MIKKSLSAAAEHGEALEFIQDRVLWLAMRMIYEANSRPDADEAIKLSDTKLIKLSDTQLIDKRLIIEWKIASKQSLRRGRRGSRIRQSVRWLQYPTHQSGIEMSPSLSARRRG